MPVTQRWNAARIALLCALLFVLLPGAASAGGTIYTVRPGDTLGNIAASLGANSSAIMRANGLTNPNMIYPGMKLTIPDATKPVASSGATQAVPAKPASSSSASVGPVRPPTPQKPGSNGNKAYNQFGGGPQTYLDPTRFAVSVSMQHCWLIQNNDVTDSWPCSTGRKGYETPPGFYTIQSKLGTVYGSRWDFFMPYWLGIYNIGNTENGIHGLPFKGNFHDWGDKIGTPISFGCVVLQDTHAKKLFDTAYIGMQVIILK